MEKRAQRPAGVDDICAVEGRVARITSSLLAPQARAVRMVSATNAAAPHAEFDDPLRSLVAAVTGAARGAEPIPNSAFRPLTLPYP
ncbi:hypothetical protein C1I97_12735 [Streptomyces sp. NTH33]|nr:hypothetical protein C1I97_12735 [Streptomyces sp. NTH33]